MSVLGRGELVDEEAILVGLGVEGVLDRVVDGDGLDHLRLRHGHKVERATSSAWYTGDAMTFVRPGERGARGPFQSAASTVHHADDISTASAHH
jgi:hypothetical protein